MRKVLPLYGTRRVDSRFGRQKTAFSRLGDPRKEIRFLQYEFRIRQSRLRGSRSQRIAGRPVLYGDSRDNSGTRSEWTQKVWHTNVSQERYYASPLVHEGLVYIFTMGQIFQVLEADTGELVYSHKIPGRMDRTFPGLLLVNDMIYAGEENGTAFFLKPGREYEELARLDVGECRSTPIFKDDVAYLRTMEKVFAFKAR